MHAEIAGAFGARYVISGTLGKLGSDRILQLWSSDVEKSETLTRTNASPATTNALAFDDVAAKVLAPLSQRSLAPVEAKGGVSPIVAARSTRPPRGSAREAPRAPRLLSTLVVRM